MDASGILLFLTLQVPCSVARLSLCPPIPFNPHLRIPPSNPSVHCTPSPICPESNSHFVEQPAGGGVLPTKPRTILPFSSKGPVCSPGHRYNPAPRRRLLRAVPGPGRGPHRRYAGPHGPLRPAPFQTHMGERSENSLP